MSNRLAIEPEPNRLVLLRRRESATEAMIRQIDEKLSRLGSARRDRATALKRIRCELVRAAKAEQAAPDSNDNIRS
jgi:hypothetical protein